MAVHSPSFAVIGDVHARQDHLARVLDRIDEVAASTPIAAVLLVGDLACCGHKSVRSATTIKRYKREVAEVLATVAARGRPMYFVPGNHDLPHSDHPANIDWGSVEVQGIRIGGVGGAGPDIFGFAYEWTEDQLRDRHLAQADLWLCHAPPRDTPIDRIKRGPHVGSTAIRELAERTRGVMVCGHIHESPGCVRLDDCLCLNVGGLGAPFERCGVGFVHGLDRVVYEDLDAGTRQVWDRADTPRFGQEEDEAVSVRHLD